MNVLIADKLPDICLEILKNANINAVNKTSLSREELMQEIGKYEGIIIRSSTKLTADVIEKADKLKVICRAGVGIDNVDVASASKKGIIVMNAPEGNITSTAEHTIALLFALSRNIAKANISMRAGEWERKKFIGTQIAGKTLGVIGMGRVGRIVAKRCAGMEMKVIAYDPFITTEMAAEFRTHMIKDLPELIKQADYITIHVPLNNDTKNLITKPQFDSMKDGVRIINCARGGIVSESDLYDAIVSGKVKGAAFDVFEIEPPKDDKLIQLDEVLTTPHLAASTFEGQFEVAKEAAEQMADALNGKGARNAMNIPRIDEDDLKQVQPFINLVEKMGSFLMQLTSDSVQTVNITYSGAIADKNVKLITDSFMVGLFRPALEEGVNLVNVALLVKERGITINETTSNVAKGFTNLITANVVTDKGSSSLSGTVFDKNEIRIVAVNDFEIETALDKHLMVLFCDDIPGLIGNIGTVIGKKAINIAHMTFGRKEVGNDSIAFLNLESIVPPETVDELKKVNGIKSAYVINL